MTDIDGALSELGMLSQVTNYKNEYIKEMDQKKIKIENTVDESMKDNIQNNLRKAGDSDNKFINITLNESFVTNIAIKDRNKTVNIDQKRLQRDIKQNRSSMGSPHCCGQNHHSSTNHLCYFVSPPRTNSYSYRLNTSRPNVNPSPRLSQWSSSSTDGHVIRDHKSDVTSDSSMTGCSSHMTGCIRRSRSSIDAYSSRLAHKITAPYFKPYVAIHKKHTLNITEELEHKMRGIRLNLQDCGQNKGGQIPTNESGGQGALCSDINRLGLNEGYGVDEKDKHLV